MSTFRAIGGVSATLKALLEDRMDLPEGVTPGTDFHITISTPSKQDEESTTARVNLFLYQVTENAFLKNQEIPGQGSSGAYGTPPLSLNLYYLITAYGTTEGAEDFRNEQRSHFLLGSAMRVLHDFPIITQRLSRTRPGSPPTPILDSSLQGEFETVKLCLEPISLEDVTKVWTALTVPFRLSAAYLVSVVQIASQRSRRLPQPVGEPGLAGPRVYALPFRSPQIQTIRVRRQGDTPTVEQPFPYARVGDTLVVQGRNLSGDATHILLGEVDATTSITSLRDDRIEVQVPDHPGLQPGVQTVTVVQDLLLGDPPTPHRGFASNLAVFMLVPTLTTIAPASGTNGTNLILTGQRLFRANQMCTVILGDLPFLLTNPAPPASPTQTPNQITIRIAGLSPGRYPVRVRVNGAESLEADKVFEVMP